MVTNLWCGFNSYKVVFFGRWCFDISRPRKNVTALQGAYTKDDMKSRLEQEKRLKGNNDNIVAPDFILDDEIALSKFEQLVEELTASEIISNVDVDLLAVYSDAWSKYVNATKMLYLQDMIELQENKLGALSKAINPYVKVQNTYSDKMMKISSLFGLSPADRSKIAHLNPSSKEEEVDPLMELLSGLKR